MSRYEKMFDELFLKKAIAFIPFVMLLDPDRDRSKNIIQHLINLGADALELGIAFSDPIADGPSLQKSALRVLKKGYRVDDALMLVEEIRKNNAYIPIGILSYANIAFKKSLKDFYHRAYEAGADSVLLADVPLIEAAEFCQEAIGHNIDPVLIAPPNFPLAKVQILADLCKGYVYVQTRAGVTGSDNSFHLVDPLLINELKKHSRLPPVFGFGISTTEHVTSAKKQGARGVIIGSIFSDIIEANLNDNSKMLIEIEKYIKPIKEACK